MPLPPKWLRRMLIAPALVVVIVAASLTMPLWLIAAAFVSRYVPGKWRILRILWFLFLYLLVEAVALVVMFLLWVASGFGWKMDNAFFQHVHYRVLALMLRTIIRTAKRTFRLSIVMDGPAPNAGPTRTRPALVLSRHAGPGDSMLLMDALVNSYGREPRIVLKEFLQWDPAVDVILNRVPASFVPSGNNGGEAVVEAIRKLAETMTVDDAFVIFPEGANYTLGRAEKAIQKLREIGRPDLAERAEMLEQTLPPKPRGVITAFAAAPLGTDVFLVGHAGLEGFVSAGDIWRAIPMDTKVVARIWHYPAEQIPGPDDQEAWLYDRWAEIDSWISGQLAATG